MSAIGRMLTVLTLPFRGTAGKISLINKGKISPKRIVKYAVACAYPLNTQARAYIEKNLQVLRADAAIKRLAKYAVDDFSKAEEYILERQEIHEQAVKALSSHLNNRKRDTIRRPGKISYGHTASDREGTWSSYENVWVFYKREKVQELLKKIRAISQNDGLKEIIDNALDEAPPLERVISRHADWQGPLR